MKHHISELFTKTPRQYGLRGDPFLWKDLEKHFSSIEFPYSKKSMITYIYSRYKEITGEELTADSMPFVKDYDKGGMSSGYISGDFWTNRGIPMITARYDEIVSSDM